MNSEKYRKEMVRLLKKHQSMDENTSMREKNWREYTLARESYFMTLSNEQGWTYSPIESTVSGVEQCKTERRALRPN